MSENYTACQNHLIIELTGNQLKVILLGANHFCNLSYMAAGYNIAKSTMHQAIKMIEEMPRYEDWKEVVENTKSANNNFTPVPNHLIEDLKGNELLVYIYILQKSRIKKTDGKAYNFAAARIANDIKLGVRAVERVLKQLEDRDWPLLQRERTAGTRRIEYTILKAKESIFDKAKRSGYSYDDPCSNILFQEFLEHHDEHFRTEDAHGPLSDKVITQKVQFLFSFWGDTVKAKEYAQRIKSFLELKSKANAHFPVFVEWIGSETNPGVFFDANGDREKYDSDGCDRMPIREEKRREEEIRKDNKNIIEEGFQPMPEGFQPMPEYFPPMPETTTKPTAGSVHEFLEIYPKKSNITPEIKSAFAEAVHYADGTDVVIVAARLHAEYIEKSGKEVHFLPSPQKWLTAGQWKTDWKGELKKANSSGKAASKPINHIANTQETDYSGWNE